MAGEGSHAMHTRMCRIYIYICMIADECVFETKRHRVCFCGLVLLRDHLSSLARGRLAQEAREAMARSPSRLFSRFACSRATTTDVLGSVSRGIGGSRSGAMTSRGISSSSISSRGFTFAVTRGIPNSFDKALSSSIDPEHSSICVEKAREEHERYVSFLRTLVPTAHLEALEQHPDCPFVEDVAVAIGGKAVVCTMGAVSRLGEESGVVDVLRQLGVKVTQMRRVAADARLDGGDVLHPRSSWGANGKHVFVGISGRTNAEGASVLEDVFGAEVEVVRVPIPLPKDGGALHLKSIVTHVDEETLLAPVGPLGDEVLRLMQADRRGYRAIRLPEAACCNVVVINGTVMATPTQCPETKDIFEREMESIGLDIKYIPNVEYAKCDGAMTCRSILLDI